MGGAHRNIKHLSACQNQGKVTGDQLLSIGADEAVIAHLFLDFKQQKAMRIAASAIEIFLM